MKRTKTNMNKTTEPIRRLKDFDAMSSYLFHKRNLRDYAFFLFGVHTGRRISDIVALNVQDVAYIDGKGKLKIVERLSIRERKTGKFIKLIFHYRVKRALGKYLKTRIKKLREQERSLGEFLREPLFTSQKPRRNGERRLTESSAWRILRDAARACGISDKIGTHSMRKTFGYLMYQDNTNIELIQRLLNHSSPSITLAYIGVTQDDLDEAILNLDTRNLKIF